MNLYESQLFHANWVSKQKTKVHFVLIHGLGDHSGRYQSLKNYLLDWGADITVFDLYGHGKSVGKRGHIESYSILMDEIDYYLNKITKNSNHPIVLYGHSMGGNIALYYCLKRIQI